MKRLTQLAQWTALLALFAATALPCSAADSAVLRNGFSIRHDHRRVIGTMTRLYLDGGKSSFVDVPTADIDHFEAAPTEAASSEAAPPHPPKDAPVPRLQGQAAVRNSVPAPNLDEVVKTASGTYNLDPDLVNSVIRAESGFNVRAVSPKGAQGLMQLMPQTASQLGVHNVFDPQANVDGGARYLRELLERYDFDLVKALAAYNAGPQRVEQYGGVPPYYETKVYVARIVRDFNRKKLAAKAAGKTSALPTAQKSSGKKPSGTPVPAAKAHTSAQAQAKATPSQSAN